MNELSKNIIDQSIDVGYEIQGGSYAFEKGAIAMKLEMLNFIDWMSKQTIQYNNKNLSELSVKELNEVYIFWTRLD